MRRFWSQKKGLVWSYFIHSIQLHKNNFALFLRVNGVILRNNVERLQGRKGLAPIPPLQPPPHPEVPKCTQNPPHTQRDITVSVLLQNSRIIFNPPKFLLTFPVSAPA